MDVEEKHLIEEAAELARENNRLLKKMRRAQLFGRTVRIIYWVLILGIAFGVLYFLQPYVDWFQSLFQNVQGTHSQLEGANELLQTVSGN